MKIRLCQLIVLLSLLCFQGCATTLINIYHAREHNEILIFGGSRADLVGCAFSPAASPWLLPLFIMDLPLSFVADILILPFGIATYDETAPSPFSGFGGC